MDTLPDEILAEIIKHIDDDTWFVYMNLSFRFRKVSLLDLEKIVTIGFEKKCFEKKFEIDLPTVTIDDL